MGIDPLLADLEARDLVHDTTDRDALDARLSAGPITVYAGFDPTADSLHIGHLVPLLLLRRFQAHGHRPIALAGGATGMVGDPSGKSEERNLLDEATLRANVEAIKGQLTRLLGEGDWTLEDNLDWTGPITLLEFLRDVGKHVTVNQMVAKESVKARMEGEQGISYTEFSYMLLQAHDYLVLHERHGCDLQVGGSDQWGNITAGIDLIRRRAGDRVHGLTCPLLTRSDGRKFGKSEEGNLWLSAERTSPYRFYQYWINVPDDDATCFLRQLTLLPLEEIQAIEARGAAAPQQREPQRALARELTTLVHGAEATSAAEEASAVLFGGEPTTASPAALAALVGEAPSLEVSRDRLASGVDIRAVLVEAGLVKSNSEANRAVEGGGAYVNGKKWDGAVGVDQLLHDRYVVVRKGKTSYALVVVT